MPVHVEYGFQPPLLDKVINSYNVEIQIFEEIINIFELK